MEFGDLELHSTKELIDELLRRKTFLGVVVHSETELRGEWQDEHVFRVHFNSNLTKAETSRLLDVVAESIDREYCD
jgi:hypothetical protein